MCGFAAWLVNINPTLYYSLKSRLLVLEPVGSRHVVSPIKIVSRVVDQGEQIHNTDTQHSRIIGGVEDLPAQADACNSKTVHTLMH